MSLALLLPGFSTSNATSMATWRLVSWTAGDVATRAALSVWRLKAGSMNCCSCARATHVAPPQVNRWRARFRPLGALKRLGTPSAMPPATVEGAEVGGGARECGRRLQTGRGTQETVGHQELRV